MKKVLFLIQSLNLPSSRIRVANLIPELEKRGLFAHLLEYPKNLSAKIKTLKIFSEFDIIYLQKKLISPWEFCIFRRFAKKIIFDFDDAIYYRNDKHRNQTSRTRLIKFLYQIKNVDFVIAGNKVLSDFAAPYNCNIEIIPSAVETRNIPYKTNYVLLDSRITIGWVGGSGNLHHLKTVAPELKTLSEIYDIDLRVISDKPLTIPSIKTSFVPWDIKTQEEQITLFDIGIMPLPKNKFSEGKCGYKILQYMAAGVPTVCSDVGGNRDIISHGDDGFIAFSDGSFFEAVKQLIENESLRERMGVSARKTVNERYSVEVAGEMLSNLLNSL